MRRQMQDLRGERRALQVLSAMSLSHLDWSDADLRGADLRGSTLRRVRLRGADLRGAHLGGVVFEDVDLTGARLEDADLRGAVSDRALPPAAPRPPARQPLLERALATDRPEDWRRLASPVCRAWGDWLAHGGRRLDLEWGSERPLLRVWDSKHRHSGHLARLSANAAWRESSHRWAEAAVAAALASAFLPDLGAMRWVYAGHLAEAPSRWSPERPLVLMQEGSGLPSFPTVAPQPGWRATMSTRAVAQGWLWGGHLQQLRVRGGLDRQTYVALLHSQACSHVEVIIAQDTATLEVLASGPVRPALRAVYLTTPHETIVLPDLSAAAPNLERLEITQRAEAHRAPAVVSVPRLVLPWLRQLSVVRRQPAGQPRAIKLRQIALGDVSLPRLVLSTLEGETIRGMMKALPLG